MEQKFDWKKICYQLIRDLTPKQKEILVRRFGLEGKEPETLQAIGRDFGITRERVRQIEAGAISKLKEKIPQYQGVFQYLNQKLKDYGNLKKEDLLLNELGNQKWKNQVSFLLNLSDDFKRFKETPEFYSLWTIDLNSLEMAKKIIESSLEWFQKIGQPRRILELKREKNFSLPEKFLASYLEISKKIHQNEEGFYGLKDWPEINPRGIKDKAFLVLKKTGKPLHFTNIAQLIPGASLQTVHNELIRDSRFVLIGRGIYALKEWGFIEGDVKEVIQKILREAQGPMTKEEILKKVLAQRQVKPSTVFLNLSNKNYFLRDSQGRYLLRENV